MMLRNKDIFMPITIVLAIVTVGLSIWELVSHQSSGYIFLLLGLLLITSGASAFRSDRRWAAYMNWIVGVFIIIVFSTSM